MKQYPDPTNLKTRFFPETGKNGSVEMLNEKHTLKGVSPPPLWFP
jgi:hypothetical protein